MHAGVELLHINKILLGLLLDCLQILFQVRLLAPNLGEPLGELSVLPLDLSDAAFKGSKALLGLRVGLVGSCRVSGLESLELFLEVALQLGPQVVGDLIVLHV